MNQQVSLAGVQPIHVGRGAEADRRREAGAIGQALTTQFIEGGQEVPVPQPTIKPQVGVTNEVAVAVTGATTGPVIANHQPVVMMPAIEAAPTHEEYLDYEQNQDFDVVDGVKLNVTQCVMYEHKLIIDWSTLPEAVMFAFITEDGRIIGATDRPVATDTDFTMENGQYMHIGNVPVGFKHTHMLTLTEREEVVQPEQQPLLMDVKTAAEPAKEEDEEPPYYFNWGAKRRNKERNKLRSMGKPVPKDL